MCDCQPQNDEYTSNCLKIMCECQRSYKTLSCSCPRSGDRMLSMFCLTASYSRIRFFRLPYSAYSRFFSSDSLEYSSRSLARSGSLSPTPAAFSARADASKRMISRSRPRRYFSLSRDFLYSLYSGFSRMSFSSCFHLLFRFKSSCLFRTYPKMTK